MGITLWNVEMERVESMTRIYAEKGVRSFPELFEYNSMNCMNRIYDSENNLIICLLTSDACIYSRQWAHWEKLCRSLT